jgi:hypothetical protein
VRKVNLLIVLITITMVLTAAVPAEKLVDNNLGKLCIDPTTGQNIPCPIKPYQPGKVKIKIPGQGEPTMEKVTYFPYLVASRSLRWFFWNWYKGDMKNFIVANYGCKTWYWRVRTWKTPVGCQFRYQY